MGIAFITDKAKKFQHQRDAAFEQELASANLFSNQPETVLLSYRFKTMTEDVLSVGMPVLIYRSDNCVMAFQFNLPIGIALEPDSSELSAMMDRNNAPAYAGQIIELRPVSGTFVVAVNETKG